MRLAMALQAIRRILRGVDTADGGRYTSGEDVWSAELWRLVAQYAEQGPLDRDTWSLIFKTAQRNVYARSIAGKPLRRVSLVTTGGVPVVLEMVDHAAYMRLSSKPQEPGWVTRNKLLTALLLVVLVILSEPAYSHLLPPEVHEFLAQEEGPAAFCMALVAAVTAAMAVNNSKNKKD
jgi:hypothetical protein